MPGVLCIGLPGSASTWVVNVTKAIVQLHDPAAQVALIYLDEMPADCEPAIQDNINRAVLKIQGSIGSVKDSNCLIIKSHAPGPALLALTGFAGFQTLLTVRDPRDAVASQMQRFGVSFSEALATVAPSAAAIERLPAQDREGALVLRYESGFTASASAVEAIARHLDVQIGAAGRSQILANFAPMAVAAYINRLAARGAFDPNRPLISQYDPDTHWHPGHIGDGMSGKWRTSLSRGQSAQVLYATRDFRKALRYPGPDPISSGTVLGFALDQAGGGWLQDGFSGLESWGVWTEGPRARMNILLDSPARSEASLEIDYRLACLSHSIFA